MRPCLIFPFSIKRCLAQSVISRLANSSLSNSSLASWRSLMTNRFLGPSPTVANLCRVTRGSLLQSTNPRWRERKGREPRRGRAGGPGGSLSLARYHLHVAKTRTAARREMRNIERDSNRVKLIVLKVRELLDISYL